jgi:hypothetical protein
MDWMLLLSHKVAESGRAVEGSCRLGSATCKHWLGLSTQTTSQGDESVNSPAEDVLAGEPDSGEPS